MSNPEPSIGRIVHVMNDDGETLPAIITAVEHDEGCIYVTIFGLRDTAPGISLSYRPVSGPKDALPRSWWWPQIGGARVIS